MAFNIGDLVVVDCKARHDVHGKIGRVVPICSYLGGPNYSGVSTVEFREKIEPASEHFSGRKPCDCHFPGRTTSFYNIHLKLVKEAASDPWIDFWDQFEGTEEEARAAWDKARWPLFKE